MLLTSTSDLIQVVTSAAGTVEVHADYADASGAPPAVSGMGRTNTSISTAATTTVVGSPAASTTRKVLNLMISNSHASTANTVTIRHTDGTTPIQIEQITLLAGERWAYREGMPSRVVDAAGLEKTNAPLAIGQYSVSQLGSTVSNSTTTAAKITGLDQVCAAGTWIFEYFLRLQSSLGTTGWKLSTNHTGTVTTFLATESFPQSNTVDSAGTADQDITAAPTVMATMAQRAKSTAAGMIATGGVDTTAADVLVQITGLMVVTVSGTLELYHASETSNSTSVMANSALRLTKVG